VPGVRPARARRRRESRRRRALLSLQKLPAVPPPVVCGLIRRRPSTRAGNVAPVDPRPPRAREETPGPNS
jgi:hypothetical protein